MIGRKLLAGIALLAACGGPLPPTKYYRLAPPPAEAPAGDGPVLVVEELHAVPLFDDTRIVYRESTLRSAYYPYQRWAADPGRMVAEFMREAYAGTGCFSRVAAEADPDAMAILGGRVIEIEEVDVAPGRWIAQVELELVLRDPDSDRVVWSKHVHEAEPLRERNVDALAAAMSRALARVVDRTASEIADASRGASTTP